MLLKTLMMNAIEPICQNENSLALAECDIKLFRVLKLFGINGIKLEKPVCYLGSETIPVAFTYESLIRFYTEHKYLLTENTLTIAS